MREKIIRKIIILLIGLFVTTTSILPAMGSMSPQTKTIQSSGTQAVTIAVQQIQDTTILQYTLDDFTMTSVEINNENYVKISLDSEPSNLIAGAPDLPSVARSIIIPPQGTMTLRVVASSYQDYENILIAPSKGNLPRTVNPADVPYEFGDIYTQDKWYPSTIATLEEPYYLRDFRGQVVRINPFQYNPLEETLRFYTDITVEIAPASPSAGNSVAQYPVAQLDSDFLSLYQHHFVNFNSGKYEPVSEQGNMLVITYDAFYSTMIPFVEWKNLKGIPTEMVNVSSIGDANAIKSYIADYYNTNGLTFVLLVGDAAQVPTFYESYAASDPSYGYIVGNDHYIDVFVGRFSAENVAQAETQANRTITYERDPMIDADWYAKGVGIASSQGVGDDNEYDYEHIRNIRELLVNFTYALVDELYDGSQGGGDAPGNPTPTMVADSLNDGRSIINYCGHGSMTSWGSSGFSNTNVNQLTNDNMLPFIVSVACNNGEFDGGTCFGEAWLRATHDGQPTGAIGAYMSTVSQSWDPPMEAQDEFNNILIGMYPENIRTTYGALCYEGSMSMIDDYGSEGIGEADYWTVFGDPSVQVRTDVPVTMEVVYDSFIPNGAESFDIDVVGFPNALCAISADGTLLGNGYTDQDGHAVVQFFTPISVSGEVQLMVTGFNAIPYSAVLTVGEPNLPPDNPAKPTGRLTGEPGKSYIYSSVAIDPDGDGIYYQWDWGDGNYSDWIGPFASGNAVATQKSWASEGTYSVRIKAKDSHGHESGWSEPLDVTMPYNIPFIIRFVDLFQNLFPHLFQFFERVLSL
jgi:hypothetical protein